MKRRWRANTRGFLAALISAGVLPHSPADAERARKSLACHVSQFTPHSMAIISDLTD